MWNEREGRTRLQERLALLEKRSAEIEGILREPEDIDVEEQALELDDDGVLEGLLLSIHEEIDAIREALLRMDQGNYGKCARCRRPIGRRRLIALPEASLCVRCALAAPPPYVRPWPGPDRERVEWTPTTAKPRKRRALGGR